MAAMMLTALVDAVHIFTMVITKAVSSQPKVFGVKFSLRDIERIFSIEIRNIKLWKMPT